jgi:hypothetical protein
VAYTTIPAAQDGSALNPYLSNSNPATSPGFAAEVHAVLKDQISGTLYVKTGTSDTAWEPISGSSAYKTDEEYYKYRAQSLMQSPRLTCWWWSDLLEPQGEEFTTSLSAGATYTTKNNACGVVSINTSTAAGAAKIASVFVGNEVDANGCAIPGGSTGVWYVASRYALSGGRTSEGNMNVCEMTLDSKDAASTGYIYAGIRALTPFTKFTVFYSNSASSAGVNTSYDTDDATHVHELSRDGTTTRYYIDESLVLSSTAAFPGGACYPGFYLSAASSATTTTSANLDFYCFAVGGNNPRTIT